MANKLDCLKAELDALILWDRELFGESLSRFHRQRCLLRPHLPTRAGGLGTPSTCEEELALQIRKGLHIKVLLRSMHCPSVTLLLTSLSEPSNRHRIDSVYIARNKKEKKMDQNVLPDSQCL